MRCSKLHSNESFDPATWTIQPVATRDSDGGTIIAASTNIPDGVKIWVQLTDGSTSKIQVFNGKFSSEAFSRKGNPIPAGSYRVTFLAYFNELWEQPASVLEITGNGGRKLKGKLFHKVDQDVVDSDVVLEYSVIVDFPSLSRDLEAISLVKSSILVVDGSRSSATIGKTVEWFLKPGTGIKMGAEGWKAIQRGSGIYEVQLYISDASNDGPALWEADLRTRKVKYINKIAKDMSYLPPD